MTLLIRAVPSKYQHFKGSQESVRIDPAPHFIKSLLLSLLKPREPGTLRSGSGDRHGKQDAERLPV